MKNKFKNIGLLVLIPFIILSIMKIIMALPMKVPIIWPDEYVYLMTGKYISGLEISTQLATLKFVGSFGYSILISPVFVLSSDPISIYQIIMIINSLLSSTLYIGLFYLLKLLFGVDNKKSSIISFIVCLYPAYLLQSNSAWTDAITPAFLVFIILAFYKFIQKNNLLWSLIFSLATGYFLWVHIRFIPITIISIIFILTLCFYKKIKLINSILSVTILICFVILYFIIGDNINTSLGGNIDAVDEFIARLLNISEVLYFIIILVSITYSVSSRNINFILSTITGVLIGFLLNISLLFTLTLPFVFIALLIFRTKLKLSKASLTLNILNLLVVALLPYFLFLNTGFEGLFSMIFGRWLNNGLGTLYYTFVSTFLLSSIGFLYVFYFLFILKTNSIFNIRLKNKLDGIVLYENEKIALLFLFISAIGFFSIVIGTASFDSTYFRADALFYGRYIEVFLSSFIAIGILQLTRFKKEEIMWFYNISILFLIIGSLILISNYGNLITSEMSIRSVLSFFPLRAVFGNINIYFFSILNIVTLTLMVLLRKKRIINFIFFGFVFFSFSLVTYFYVFIYHQYEQINKNHIVTNISNNFPNFDSVYYDTRINTEYSRNLEHFIWLQPNKKFILFKPTTEDELYDKVVISNKFYGFKESPDAILLDVEYGGFDHLWLNPGKLQNSLRTSLMPSFYDVPLNYDFVAGVNKSGIYPNNFLGKNSTISFKSNKFDSIPMLSIVLTNTHKVKQKLQILLNKIEFFNQNIEPGVWRYDLKFNFDEPLNKYEFKFITGIAINNYDTLGIKLDTLILRSQENGSAVSCKNNTSYNLNKDLNFTMRFRRNIDLLQLILVPGQEIWLPVIVQNKGKIDIYPNSRRKIYVTYKWLDFLFKRPVSEGEFKSEITDVIKGGIEGEVFLKIKAPDSENRYFLQLCFYQEGVGYIEQYSETGNLYLFDTRKDVERIKFY